MSIEAPYNFIPLNKEVFYPDWDKQVSHDIPFSDGESGEIKIEIKAESPIYIRNHYEDGDEYYELTKDQKKVKVSKEFCHIKKDGAKEYYIPATSMKGMVRNIVEIMSFAKIKLDEERLKEPLSVRDMTPKQYCEDSSIRRLKDCPQQKKIDLYSFPVVATAQKCGFLIKQNGVYKLEDCDKIVVISHQELKNSFNINVKSMEKASKKYTSYSNRVIQVDTFPVDRQIKAKKGSKKKAEIIFTGDITNKKHEFVFITNGNFLDVGDEIIKSFKSVYFQDTDSDLGQYWKSKSKIPVFYTTNAKGKLKAIGLTQIFKLAYNKTLLEAAEQKTQKGRYDLAETLFGYVDGKKALKGRVIFSHFKSNTVSYQPDTKSEILGSPNPSYYPNYIEQEELDGSKVKRYTTLMDDATIRGYKHYPLQPKLIETQSSDKEKVKTHFKPLDTGTTFEGVLRFHNLKKAEIGAILSALTFHNQGDDYRHNIGMAKSLGYGKISITLEKFTYSEKLKKENQTEYIESFKEMMNSWNDKPYTNWKDSPQLQNLLAMHDNNKTKSLRYQQLDKQEFANAKKKREYLEPYVASKIVKVPKKSPVVKEKVAPIKSEGVSRTQMKKAIIEFWQNKFQIEYHPNHIKEFFSEEGFMTTPEEQRDMYEQRREDQAFILLLKLINKFNKSQLDKEVMRKLYESLTK